MRLIVFFLSLFTLALLPLLPQGERRGNTCSGTLDGGPSWGDLCPPATRDGGQMQRRQVRWGAMQTGSWPSSLTRDASSLAPQR